MKHNWRDKICRLRYFSSGMERQMYFDTEREALEFTAKFKHIKTISLHQIPRIPKKGEFPI